MINKYTISIIDIDIVIHANTLYLAFFDLSKRLNPEFFQMPRKVVMNGWEQPKDAIIKAWDRFKLYEKRHPEGTTTNPEGVTVDTKKKCRVSPCDSKQKREKPR